MEKKFKIEHFSSGNIVKVLRFDINLGDNSVIELGINIQKVKEIVQDVELQTLPSNYFPFLGVIDLKGIPVPILLLSHFFQESENHDFKLQHERIIVCEFQNIIVGLIVNSTKRIQTFDNSKIAPVPGALDTTQMRLFNGVIKTPDGFVNLLDIELIFEKLKIDLGPARTIAVENKVFSNLTALVAEDSKLFQKKITSLFDKLGIKVYMANDGEEGIEILKNNIDKIDFVFTDIEMPHLNGLGMVRKIKEIPEAQNLPIIFNTSISNPGLVEDIKSNDLGEFIVKFDEVEILNALRKISENF
ncbi:MAG: chemotaxis protein CheV [Bacteriovoracaceae bacterium]